MLKKSDSVWKEHRLSLKARVLSSGPDRLILDPENYDNVVRVRLDRKPHGVDRYVCRFDVYRPRELAAVMRDVPPAFYRSVISFFS